MKQIASLLALCILLAGRTPSAAGQDVIDGFAARVFARGRDRMPYRLFVPKDYSKERSYPLIIWLHGAGGSGTDNVKQITGDQIRGTRIWTSPESQVKHPAFVLVPQTGGDARWDNLGQDELSQPESLVLGIIESLESEFRIDSKRIYLTGQSNGGIGTWDLVTKRPDLFAAAVALCGVGNPEKARSVVNLPIWAFHGARDDVISVEYSRAMIAAIRKAGGHPLYTEYKDVGHEVWIPAFSEPGLADWLFAQHR